MRVNKEFSVCLTHDVDKVYKSYQYITHFIRSLRKKDFRRSRYHLFSIFKSNPYWNFDRIIKIENKFFVKSTFFFLNESIKFNIFKVDNWKLSVGNYRVDRYPKLREMICWLDRNGWEIGLHGSYNSFIDISLLRKEKTCLEKIIGHEIIGIRQHYLKLNDNTWKIQENAGFKYDASFGFTQKVGFRDDKIYPFSPHRVNNYKFIVFPLAIMDLPLMNIANYWDVFLEIIKLAQKNEGLLVINWHQRVFNEVEFPNYSKTYIRIIEECKKRNARFYTLGEYYKKLTE